MSSTIPRAPPVVGMPSDEDPDGDSEIAGIQKLEREVEEVNRKAAKTQSRYEAIEEELERALEECEGLSE